MDPVCQAERQRGRALVVVADARQVCGTYGIGFQTFTADPRVLPDSRKLLDRRFVDEKLMGAFWRTLASLADQGAWTVEQFLEAYPRPTYYAFPELHQSGECHLHVIHPGLPLSRGKLPREDFVVLLHEILSVAGRWKYGTESAALMRDARAVNYVADYVAKKGDLQAWKSQGWREVSQRHRDQNERAEKSRATRRAWAAELVEKVRECDETFNACRLARCRGAVVEMRRLGSLLSAARQDVRRLRKLLHPGRPVPVKVECGKGVRLRGPLDDYGRPVRGITPEGFTAAAADAIAEASGVDLASVLAGQKTSAGRVGDHNRGWFTEDSYGLLERSLGLQCVSGKRGGYVVPAKPKQDIPSDVGRLEPPRRDQSSVESRGQSITCDSVRVGDGLCEIRQLTGGGVAQTTSVRGDVGVVLPGTGDASPSPAASPYPCREACDSDVHERGPPSLP